VAGKQLTIEGVNFSLDEDGYLEDRGSWSESFARIQASADGIELDEAHWEIIHFVQEYFERFEIAPPMRAMVRAIGQRLGAEKASSRYLYRLFPDGPAKQVCRYAGLPKPVSCI